MVVWSDERPRISLTLTPVVANFIMERLDPSLVQARAIPTMVLWDEQKSMLGQLLVCAERVRIFRPHRAGSRTWRAPLRDLRPPLYQELMAATKGQRRT